MEKTAGLFALSKSISRKGMENCRSLGSHGKPGQAHGKPGQVAPAAGRGRRDDKGESGAAIKSTPWNQ